MAVLAERCMGFAICEPGIVLLCVFILANLPAQVAFTPVLTPEDVFSISGEKCVVAISDKLLQQTTRVGKDTWIDRLLGLADVAFREEPNVVFGVSNLEYFVGLSGEYTKDPTAVVFPQIIDDQVPLTSVEYRGSGLVADFIAFVNKHCNTYRAEDGRLTLEGLRRKALLEDLFKVEQLPQSVTISQVFQTTDLLHSDANCLRENGSDVCYSSQSVHRGIKKFRDIPRCERISLPSRHKFFNEYLARSRPVIITDAMDNWPAMSKWTTEFLRDRYGDKRVAVQLTPKGEYTRVEPLSIWNINIPQAVLKRLQYPDLVVVQPAGLDMKFSDFLDLMRNVSEGKTDNVSAYMAYLPVSRYLQELKDDIEEMPFFKNTLQPDEQNIWFSDGNTLANIHYDGFDNFLCQISGTKEVILFEPHNNERLYEAYIAEAILTYNASTKEFWRAKTPRLVSKIISPVDIKQPNLERFKKFGEARPMSCTIKQGEVLYIPAFWWHEVQSRPSPTEHRNLAVNSWYDPFFRKKVPCAECRLDVNPKYKHLW
ncbi:hypothetical protein BaRGS_00023372 [Batillaria attramentaria]|uniref:JmjC domain-containing protein n=1 Tax=Batillaria attramentaria TaxID=370345 RepID=A0ABD0KE72_9CAEN